MYQHSLNTLLEEDPWQTSAGIDSYLAFGKSGKVKQTVDNRSIRTWYSGRVLEAQVIGYLNAIVACCAQDGRICVYSGHAYSVANLEILYVGADPVNNARALATQTIALGFLTLDDAHGD